jgi:hypothetical protein
VTEPDSESRRPSRTLTGAGPATPLKYQRWSKGACQQFLFMDRDARGSVAGWMRMDISRRADDKSIWSASSLDALPIPDFFNCCSLSKGGMDKAGMDKRYGTEPSGRKERGARDSRKPHDIQKRRFVPENPAYSTPDSKSFIGMNRHADPPVQEVRSKQIGKSLTAAAAKKLLQEMGVNEESQHELHNFQSNDSSPHSSHQGHRATQNPRVLVRRRTIVPPQR